MSEQFDQKEYRMALGGFPTGVCIISAYDPKGEPIGITANSFTSVSMDPPLLLWCPSKSSSRHDIFASASHFAINVLAHEDEALAKAVAKNGYAIKETALVGGNVKTPVLQNSVCVFECKQHATHTAGDHTIVVGEVQTFKHTPQPALLFSNGSFRSL
ncbi:MAG: flavin reductase family protein [Planktomarina sp.]